MEKVFVCYMKFSLEISPGLNHIELIIDTRDRAIEPVDMVRRNFDKSEQSFVKRRHHISSQFAYLGEADGGKSGYTRIIYVRGCKRRPILRYRRLSVTKSKA